MSKILCYLTQAVPAVLGATFLAASSAIAAPTPEVEGGEENNFPQNDSAALSAQAAPTYAKPEEALGVLRSRPTIKVPGTAAAPQQDAMSQVTNVSELRDVAPDAWAFEALRSLVERYGCIVGYPDRTFRGDRALTRWEFAAGLNACMNVIERLLQENVAVLREDIDKLKRLAEEFKQELAALGTRLDNLESRVSFLEDHQFSTTTKLKGEVVFSIADSFGDQAIYDYVRETDFFGTQTVSRPNLNRSLEDVSQTVFQNRVRLNLETSFTGKDVLRTRLQAGNAGGGNRFRQRGVTGTNMTRLAYDDGENNDLTIDDLFYRTPLFDSMTLWVGANALALDDVLPTASPYLESSGGGSLSRLLRYNNMVYRGPGGTGAALKYNLSKEFYIVGTYLADDGDAPNPSQGAGLFNGNYSGGAQIGYKGDSLEVSLGYLHTYITGDGPGIFDGITSNDADKPFGSIPTSADRIGLSASFDVTDWLNIFGWVGYGSAVAQDTDLSPETFITDAGDVLERDVVVVQRGDQVDLWTWSAGLNFLDLGKEGAVLTVGGGLPPKGNVSDSSYIIQTQYNYPVTKNLAMTPGFYVIVAPNNNNDNDAIWMGVLRATYRF